MEQLRQRIESDVKLTLYLCKKPEIVNAKSLSDLFFSPVVKVGRTTRWTASVKRFYSTTLHHIKL